MMNMETSVSIILNPDKQKYICESINHQKIYNRKINLRYSG